MRVAAVASNKFTDVLSATEGYLSCLPCAHSTMYGKIHLFFKFQITCIPFISWRYTLMA
jgi:hypothetical protein